MADSSIDAEAVEPNETLKILDFWAEQYV